MASRAVEDLERLTEFLLADDADAALHTAELILDALSVLAAHPLIGRPVTSSLRELVISRGRTGYVALYTYDKERDRVWIKTIRHQREGGFDEDS
jgi:plasmid stabilization system protein ParE